jgi:aldose 1-epimerase
MRATVSFWIRQETRANTLDRDPAVWVLGNDQGHRLEVWPAMGFNAYRWAVAGDPPIEMLWRDSKFFDEAKPSRSGFPILFPFPNRIRDGQFTFAEKQYNLPKRDPAGKNAIHGFVLAAPWQVVYAGADWDSAWIVGEVVGSAVVPDLPNLWPADFRLRISYRLGKGCLRVDATAMNPGPGPLPMGLGYHPYFRTEPFGGDSAIVQLLTQRHWQLEENLPTGAFQEVSAGSPTVSGAAYRDVKWDDLFSGFTQRPDSPTALIPSARMSDAAGTKSLTLSVSADFPWMVAFTPPHREAVCFEPYTCPTDAINATASSELSAGWRQLRPGEAWKGSIELRCEGP